MNVLHITDFHFKPGSQDAFRQEKVISNIISHIQKNDIKIDFVFFSGDLVNSGSNRSEFIEASNQLIDTILSSLHLEKEQFFICQGNHDVDRSKASAAIISRIDSFKTNKEINDFVKKEDIDFSNSTLPLSNYDSFIESFFPKRSKDKKNFGYSSHLRNFEGKKLGILCINTAWRAVGNHDEGNLVFPICFLEEGLNDLKDCDLKILIHHHPLSQFKLYNQYELEDIIHNNFNISFSGHLHKNNTTICYTDKDGILKLASAATLAESDGSTIGFTVLNINLESFQVEASCFKYDQQDCFFYTGKPARLQIPVELEKEKQNKFRQRLRALYDDELENADDLFLNGKSNKDNKGFKELWTNPVLSTKSAEEVKKDGSVAMINLDDILKSYNNYLIMGDDKCGKTSLLKKIQLECLGQYNLYEKIPIYFDAKKIDKADYVSTRLEKDLANYFQVNRNTAKELVKKEIVLLLVDNLDLSRNEDIRLIEDLLNSFNYAQIIICTDQNSASKYQDLKINDYKVTYLYFHSLKQKQLRELAEKFYGSSESKIEVMNRINHIFNMLAIPFNFWSVSLFMWVFKDSRKDITNDVDLVDLYIESILEREKLIKSKGGFSYDKYKQYLAHLARYLLNFNKTNYSATRDEIYDFTKGYLIGNPRNNVDANTIWDYIIDKDIIKNVDENRYAFRLNGVFEYFLAHYLRIDSNFREQVIADNNIYLSFKNELEMYAGSNRGDEEFVQKIFNKTRLVFNKINTQFGSNNIDSMLNTLTIDGIAEQIEKSQTDLLKQVLSAEDMEVIDEMDFNNLNIQENCEVRLKRFIPIDEDDIVSLEKALYILGRVFKNADDITNNDLINEIFDYIIDTTVSWGYKLFETFKPHESDLEKDKHQASLLIKLMRQMLPIIVQSRISDMIGANNMQSIIQAKFSEIRLQGDKNQFKKFILLYTLADIDLVKNHSFIKQSINEIKIPILRYSILMKILYYYNFRLMEHNSSIKERIGKNLQSYFAEAGSKFNNKLYNKDRVNQTFQSLDRMKTINANKNKI